ncbi:hypothetical protein O6H91_15G074000 [Diphasiastrum complanatum]|uniref:Uncharacterized protein n=1 Tax=Diphasiastrum complanatum TaxID=34168 RepID=A0ACC2BJM2_DIPCM|nr:hypothetical protein O6H91_15G074000 [Diphasiastrum complanatum]
MDVVAANYFHRRYKSCCEAISTVLDTIQRVIAFGDSQQYYVIQVLSDLPLSFLGNRYLTAFKGRFNAFFDSLCKAVRSLSIAFFVQVLFRATILMNPKLDRNQHNQLMSTIFRLVEQLLIHHSFNESLLRGIIRLASPDRELFLLLNYLVKIMAALASTDQFESGDSNHQRSDLDTTVSLAKQKYEVEAELDIAEALIEEFCIKNVYAFAMPCELKKAVLVALRNETDRSANLSLSSQIRHGSAMQSSPVCCITLEPLLTVDGRITRDVVAVRCRTSSKERAFLYRGCALLRWLGTTELPRSPETRSLVRPTDLYRIS